jgi:hypothetical protein
MMDLYGPLVLLRAFSSLAALSNNMDSALLLSDAVKVYLPCTYPQQYGLIFGSILVTGPDDGPYTAITSIT